MSKQNRLVRANELLATIAGCGRRFFRHKERVSQFELDERGRLWLHDCWTDKRVYVAYRGRWRHFSEGGTMRTLIEALSRYVRSGERLNPNYFGPWPPICCDGDLWGYGYHMECVRTAARQLDIVRRDHGKDNRF